MASTKPFSPKYRPLSRSCVKYCIDAKKVLGGERECGVEARQGRRWHSTFSLKSATLLLEQVSHLHYITHFKLCTGWQNAIVWDIKSTYLQKQLAKTSRRECLQRNCQSLNPNWFVINNTTFVIRCRLFFLLDVLADFNLKVFFMADPFWPVHFRFKRAIFARMQRACILSLSLSCFRGNYLVS